jgi:hypothetical protein
MVASHLITGYCVCRQVYRLKFLFWALIFQILPDHWTTLSFNDFGHTRKNKRETKIFDRKSAFVGRPITHPSKTIH